MFRIEILTRDIEKIISEQNKKIRRDNKRAMNRVVTELKKDVTEATPIDTASLSKTWIKYYNVDKGGLSSYGAVFLDKDIKFKITYNKRGQKTSRKVKQNQPILKTDKIKHPYKYGFIVEKKQRFVNKVYYKNKDKYAEIFLKEFGIVDK